MAADNVNYTKNALICLEVQVSPPIIPNKPLIARADDHILGVISLGLLGEGLSTTEGNSSDSNVESSFGLVHFLSPPLPLPPAQSVQTRIPRLNPYDFFHFIAKSAQFWRVHSKNKKQKQQLGTDTDIPMAIWTDVQTYTDSGQSLNLPVLDVKESLGPARPPLAHDGVSIRSFKEDSGKDV